MENEIYFLNGSNLEIDAHYSEKEYRDDVLVKLDNLFYELYFFTADSLEYEMTKDGYFSFPGLIILDEITKDKIKASIHFLKEKGFFTKLVGSKEFSPNNRFVNSWYVNHLDDFIHQKLTIEELD